MSKEVAVKCAYCHKNELGFTVNPEETEKFSMWFCGDICTMKNKLCEFLKRIEELERRFNEQLDTN